MAIQNFVSGGFYGKVGEFVGQRWKNIRTIHAYFIPHNPRTPAQQANRKFFSKAVPMAQIANSCYPHCPAFDTSTNTQWAYRMSDAKLALEAGEQDVNIVPVFPKNFIAPYTVSKCVVTEILNTRQITVEISGNLPSEARSFSALLYFDDGDRAEQMIICSGKSTAEKPNEILLECGDTLDIDTAKIFCRVFSNDDKTADTIIGCARIELEKDLIKAFNIATDLEEIVLNDDGTISAIYKTPNAWEDVVSGNVSAAIDLTSSTRTMKSGFVNTDLTNVFTVSAEFANVGGSVGVKVYIVPTISQEEALSYVVDGTLSITYTDAKTATTEPNSGTQTFDFTQNWNNKQPIFSATVELKDITVNADGSVEATYATGNVWDDGFAGDVSTSLSFTMARRRMKDGTVNSETTNVFTNSTAVQNVGGLVGVKISATPTITQKTMAEYAFYGSANISWTNAYTKATRPNTDTKAGVFNPTWTNKQPKFALSSNYLQPKGENFIQLTYNYIGNVTRCEAEWRQLFETNPTSANDKAFQQSMVGKTAKNFFRMDTGAFSTWRLTTSAPTTSETANFSLTDFSVAAVSSQTQKVEITPTTPMAIFNNAEYENEPSIDDFKYVSTPKQAMLYAKITGFYTDDTMPATEDKGLNLSLVIMGAGWGN